MGFVSVRGTSGPEPRPCHRWYGELEFLSPVLIWVAQSKHCIYVCVEGNVIYSLVAFVIIFLRNIILALIVCMYDEGMKKIILRPFLTGRIISTPDMVRAVDELYFVFELRVGRTFRSPNMARTVRRTILRFLTDLIINEMHA